MYQYFFIAFLCIRSTVSILSVEVETYLELNNGSLSEKKDSTGRYPTQSYGREPPQSSMNGIYSLYGKFIANRAGYTKLSITAPIRSLQIKNKHKLRLQTVQNTEHKTNIITRNKKRKSNAEKHHHKKKPSDEQANFINNHSSPPGQKASTSRYKLHPQPLNVPGSGKNPHFDDNINSHLDTADMTARKKQSDPNIPKMEIMGDLVDMMQKVFQNLSQGLLINKTENYFNKQFVELQKRTLTSTNLPAQVNFNGSVNLWQLLPHKVKDNAKVMYFINQSHLDNVLLFHTLENKIKDEVWAPELHKLTAEYIKKNEEFIKDISNHKIKSRRGVERAILNDIDVSNRSIKRLFNFLLDDMEKKDLLDNSRNINIISTEIKRKTNAQHERVCLKLSICRYHKGFSAFVIDVMTIILSVDYVKFEKAYNSLTATVQRTNFSEAIGEYSDKALREHINNFEDVDLEWKRAVMTIIRNIFSRRNAPIIVYGDSDIGSVHKTIALLEIIYTLDQSIPDNEEIFQEWVSIKTDMEKFASNQDTNIDGTMLSFVTHLKSVVNHINPEALTQLMQNCKELLQ